MSYDRPERFRPASMRALVVGAVGSLALTFHFGRRQPSVLVLLFFAFWVFSPFAALAWMELAAKRIRARSAVAALTFLVAIGSLVVYGAVALGPARPQPARFFLLTPAASWLLIAVAAISLFRTVAIITSALALTIGSLFTALWLERTADIELPRPTGPSAVGRAIYDWKDEASVDALAPVPGARRELLGWIWYPAQAAPRVEPDDYIPERTRTAMGPARGPMRYVSHDVSKVHAHSIRNAGVSPQRPNYPVVILRGGASLEVVNYTTLAEDLASHGYIVVGIDAPYRTGIVAFPDGRTMTRIDANNPELYTGDEFRRVAEKLMAAWTSDIGFVLDRLAQLNASDSTGRFTGRLDMARVGVFGHSFGGAQAVEFCHVDGRCKAAIDIGGAPFGSVIQDGVRKPLMFLVSSEGDFSTDAETRRILADVQSIYNRVPPNDRIWLSIRGASHFTFTDDGAVLKSRFVRGLLRLFGKLQIDGRRQLTVAAYCVRTFFDAYLNGRSPAQIASVDYPELEIVR